MKKLRRLEDENARLRKVVADLTLDKEMLQEVIRRNACSGTRVDAQSLPNSSGMPRDVSLPLPPTRAGASQNAYPRDRRDTDA